MSKIAVNKTTSIYLALTIVLVASLVVFLIGYFSVFNKPYEVVLGESFLWYQSDMVSNGMSPYQPLSDTYYQSIPHTPLFVLLCGGLTKIFGSSIVIGRVVSLLFGIGMCVMVYLIVKRFTNNVWASIVAGLLVVTSQVFRFVTPIYRMDTMAIFLCLLGVFLFMKYEDRKLMYLSIPIFILAIFTKQYFIAAPLAVCLYLLLKDKKRFLKYTGILVGSFGLSLLIAGLVTNWQLVIHNFIWNAYGSVWVDWIWTSSVSSLLIYHAPIVAILLAYFGYRLYKKVEFSVVDWYFLMSLAVLLLTVGKFGASFHYGLEVAVVGCIIVGFVLSDVLLYLKTRKLKLVEVLGVGIVVTLVGLQVLGFPLGQGFSRYSFQSTTAEASNEVVEFLEGANPAVFSVVHIYPMISDGDFDWDPIDTPAVVIGRLYERDWLGWDETTFINKFETGYYDRIVLAYDIEEWLRADRNTHRPFVISMLFSERMIYAILENYTLVGETEWLGTNYQAWKAYLYEYTGHEVHANAEH